MIKELRQEFEGIGEVRGFCFRCIRCDGYAYLYEVDDCVGGIYYEVFERRINERFSVVRYPSSKSFGIWALTTRSLDVAHAYFDEFSANVRRRESRA